MCASEHCAQREESLQVVKADNMQLPVCIDWRTNWELGTNFHFRLRRIYTRMTKVRRRFNGLRSESSQTLGTVNTNLGIPELEFLSKFFWCCLFYWSSAVRNSSILSIKTTLCLNLAETDIHIQPVGHILHLLINTLRPRIDVTSFRHAVGCIWRKIGTPSYFSTTKKRKEICISNNMPKQDPNCKSKCTRGLCSTGWCFCDIIFLVVLGFDSSSLLVVKINHILCNTFKE
jgi:hypothetical protein